MIEQNMHTWEAVLRCDQEEKFETIIHVYLFPVSDLTEATKLVEKDIRGNYTLVSLTRIDL